MITDLGTLPGGNESVAVAVNERGEIVGWSATTRSDAHGFYWQEGKMRDLGTLGGLRSFAVAINERGQIVGHADTGAKDDGWPVYNAFLWQSGKMRDLGTSAERGARRSRSTTVGRSSGGRTPR